ncbi:anti-sigma factor [Actinomycetes bacterium KLBMP 9759]
MTCAELAELVTEHLEGTLDDRAFLQHLAECPACAEYVDQLVRTIELLRTSMP